MSRNRRRGRIANVSDDGWDLGEFGRVEIEQMITGGTRAPRLDHLGIAGRSIAAARGFYELLGMSGERGRDCGA